MGFNNNTIRFIILSWISITGMNLSAQEKSKTPDGNSLERVSYYNVKSVIPAPLRRNDQTDKTELPCFTTDDVIISHTGYTLSYNSEHRQANWVAYELTADETRSRVKRNNRFIADPKVSEGSSSNNDYKSSGFDRGHLAPCADMCYSQATMQESFYLSNMSPQKPGFNRGIWKNLEDLLRQWVKEDSALFIATGGVLVKGLPAIGQNEVSVPRLFYKVVLVSHGKVRKGIGFVIPNEKSTQNLQQYAVSVDSVEVLTGFNFFCHLNDDFEEKIECQADTSLWHWNSTSKPAEQRENE